MKNVELIECDFLGEYDFEDYKISRDFIDGEGTHLRLYQTIFSPKEPAIATIVIVHGFGEHSGRFKHVAQFFVKQKYEVMLVDMRGFGYSGGPRGCSEVEDLHRDVLAVIKMANPEIPLFLYGHSLGALVVSTLAYQYPHINISGLFLTSPLFGFPTDRRLPFLKTLAIKFLGAKMQDFVVNSMVNPTALTKSNKHIQTIYGDRLMIPFLSVKMGRSVLINVQKIQSIAPTFNIPMILFHGKQDSVTNYHDSVHFIDKLGCRLKMIHLFENGYHELQHDEECDEMLRIGSKWLAQLPKTALGAINLQRRRYKPQVRIPWRLIILAVVYLLIAIRMSRKSQTAMSLLQVLAGPISSILARFQ